MFMRQLAAELKAAEFRARRNGKGNVSEVSVPGDGERGGYEPAGGAEGRFGE